MSYKVGEMALTLLGHNNCRPDRPRRHNMTDRYTTGCPDWIDHHCYSRLHDIVVLQCRRYHHHLQHHLGRLPFATVDFQVIGLVVGLGDVELAGFVRTQVSVVFHYLELVLGQLVVVMGS